jgi:hypothetical protein
MPDHAWFMAQIAPYLNTAAPASAANISVQNTPTPFKFEMGGMPDLDDKKGWTQHVMRKNYDLSNSADPDIAAKALDRLAKTSVVGLYEDRVQVNVTQLPPEELQRKIESLVNRINERVVSG